MGDVTKTLDLILRTKKTGTGEKDAAKGLAGLKDAAKGLGMAFGVAAAAVGATKMAFDAIVTPTVDYGLAVRDLATRLSVTTEEASKFIQIGDDLRLSQQQLETGFRFLVAKGIQPTVNNLADLSDEYRSIKDPIEKAAFAMEHFGARSGLEMTKLLDAGGDSIREMADDAEKLGLVLGQDATDGAQDFYEATDLLNDSLLGLKVTVGTAVLPTIVEAIDTFGRWASAWQAFSDPLYDDIPFLLRGMKSMSDSAADRDFAEALGGLSDDFAEVGRSAQGGSQVAVSALDTLKLEMESLNEDALLTQAALATLAGQTELAAKFMADYRAAKRLNDQLRIMRELLKRGMSAAETFRRAEGIAGGGPNSAEGGPVMAGGRKLVGERGPEMFVPATAGTIVPNGKGGVGLSIGSITVNNSLEGSALDRRLKRWMEGA